MPSFVLPEGFNDYTAGKVCIPPQWAIFVCGKTLSLYDFFPLEGGGDEVVSEYCPSLPGKFIGLHLMYLPVELEHSVFISDDLTVAVR